MREAALAVFGRGGASRALCETRLDSPLSDGFELDAQPSEQPANWILSRRVFLVALSIVYAIAFVSLWVQLDGLIGSSGISPAEDYLSAVREQAGPDAFWQLPTLFWFSSSDAVLHAACAAGVVAAVLSMFGVAPVFQLALMWLLYLSFVVVAEPFFSYQWDTLLLETGLVACLCAPTRRAGLNQAPPRAGIWALRWLLFRLVFTSGVVKLASGDPTWRNLTALEFHYWTQPLPHAISYFAYQLPNAVQRLSTLGALVVECVAPLLIFVPGRPRTIAAGAIAALMIAIGLTGNYGFFNLSTLALCVVLLDDSKLRRFLPLPPASPAAKVRRFARTAVCVLLALHAGIGTIRMLDRIGLRLPWPGAVRTALAAVAPLRSANSYGLFAVMTTDRNEIEVEGSRDGENWSPYTFRWKPGPLDRAPGFAEPHMPRLDWQMWFAALGDCRSNPWFVRFLERLLSGSRPVAGLLEHDPFEQEPPRYVRSTVYRYRFAPLGQAGLWWQREPLGAYCPVLTLDSDRLRAVERAPQ